MFCMQVKQVESVVTSLFFSLKGWEMFLPFWKKVFWKKICMKNAWANFRFFMHANKYDETDLVVVIVEVQRSSNLNVHYAIYKDVNK